MYSMRNNYNCISVVSITKAIFIALLVILPNLLSAQQSPSIQSGVTFQWSDTQANLNEAATVESVTIGSVIYNTFVVPTSYEMTRLGPNGDEPNRIRQNGSFVGGNSGQVNWNTNAINAFQDKNLNHYFTALPNGRDICGDFNAALTTDAQKQTIFYSPAIPSNQDGVLAVTERGGNNCFYIEVWGIPVGGGLEQKLGQTFVRNSGDYRNCTFGPPVNGSDYWRSGRCNENNQTVGIGLFFLNDIAPTGSKITKIEFVGATTDHGDGKFFLLQKYAVDQQNTSCIDSSFSGDLNIGNNLPENSTYTLISDPIPAGQSFTFDSNGLYSYEPSLGFMGDVTFEYQVCLPAPNTTVCDIATSTISIVALPPMPEASISCGSENDNFTISITSPLGPEYEYALNNGTYQSSPDFDNLLEGSYTISINSTFTACENINTTPFILDNLELSGIVTDVLCKLDDTGAIDITASGGSPPYTYSWSNSSTSEDLSGILGGTYTIVVTDQNGCTITDQFIVSEPSESLTSTILTTDILCNGDNTGAIDLTISGGTAPYTMLWNNGLTTEDLSDLVAGVYIVTITDANNCVTTNTGTINEPAPVDCQIIVENCPPLIEPICSEGPNGTPVTWIPPNFSYQCCTSSPGDKYSFNVEFDLPESQNDCWEYSRVQRIGRNNLRLFQSNGNNVDFTTPLTYLDTSSNTPINVEFIVPSGTFDWTLEVLSNSSVIYSDTVSGISSNSLQVITIPSTVESGAYKLRFSFNDNGTNLNANDKIEIDRIYYDAILLDTACADGINFAVTSNYNPGDNFPNGNTTVIYTATYTYANGDKEVLNCSFDVDVTDLILTENVTDHKDASCNGTSDGAFTVVATSGTAPFGYSLDNLDFSNTTGVFSNIAAGIYTVYIKDANDCADTITVTITEPVLLEASINTITNVLCSGEATGGITIDILGGTEPYLYSWSNSVTSQNLTDVIAGAYTVTVTDANGCSVSANATITEPASPLGINISKMDANTAQGCANGEATADLSGGTAPYSYQWSASANNQTSSNATNLPDGTHSVTVTDANGCQITQDIVIVCVNTCDAILTIDTITNVLCVGDSTGAGTITASSDANPGASFTFTWSNGQVDSGVTTSTLSNLTAGIYDVSVTIDGTLCEPVEEIISITEPNNALDVTATSTDELGPNTNDGTASANATGGTAPYTYLWSPGGETTQNISGLSSGTYSVTVTDANGCTDTITITVNTGTCNNLSISGTSTEVVCNGENNGSVTAIVSNGVGPYTYAWDTLPNTTSSVSGLSAGSYTVTVTDQTTLCTQSTTIAVNEPNALSTGIVVINILCNGDDTGSVDLTVTGGTSPYTYLWNTGASTEDIINVAAGTYSVTITDANGCTTINQSEVLEPTDIVSGSIIQITNVECLDENTGSISVQGSGGIPPYTYSINNGTTSQASGLFENLNAGNYTILITDANGCTFNINGTIGTDDVESPEITVPETLLIEGCSIADITNENAIFVYSNTQSSDVQSIFASNTDYNASDDFNIQSITYIDVITSTNNCPITVLRTFTVTDNCNNSESATQTITVQDTTAPSIALPSNVTIECTEDESSANTGVASGIDNCSTVSITESDSITATCGNTKTIIRTWTATDECGNTTSADQTITVQDTTPPTFTVPADLTVECDVDATDLTITGDVIDEADNCTTGLEAMYSDSISDGNCANESVITRTWSLTDACDNTTTLVQTINVVDTTAPTFTVPANLNVECDVDVTDLTITGDVTDEADNCTTSLEAIYSDSISDGNCANESVITRTWSLTDTCDNTTTLVQTINVVDTTAPTFTVPANLNVECDVDATDLTITGDVTDEADNCSSGLEASYSDSIANGNCANESVITRTWSLTDDCDNTATFVQTINVVDTTAPTFDVNLPSDVTLECDAIPSTDTITATDNCSDVTITFEESTTAGSCDNEYTLVRTWTATDDCGNETIQIQTITIQDTTAPSFNESLPSDINAECDAVPTAETLTASDNCSSTADVTFEENITNGTCIGDYIIERTWSVTDSCGNEAVHTQIITVQDTTAPTLTTPFDENITIACDDIPAVPDLMFEDSCSNDIEVVFNENSTQINDFDDYYVIRTWTVTDDCGNVAQFVQDITVEINNVIDSDDANRCILDDEFDLFTLLSGDFSMDGTWTVVAGIATLDGSFFDPASVDVGIYTFMYAITEGPCPTEVEVTVTVDDDCVVLACGQDDVVISKTVTANGDAYNEFFEITGIEECGFVIELQIYNRWGAKIFESKNYQNDWNGDNHGSSVGSSGKVPTGTYYYILNLRNSGLNPVGGPIYVATK